MVGPTGRPGARGLGPGPQIWNCFAGRAGPGHNCCGRVGPGPHNSICEPGPGQGQVCTTAAGPGRAWPSNYVCGPGLGIYFRSVQGPSTLAESLSGLERWTGGRVVLCMNSAAATYFRFWTLAIPFTPLCQCLSEETLTAVGPFYLVSMPGEVKYPTSLHWECVTYRGLHYSFTSNTPDTLRDAVTGRNGNNQQAHILICSWFWLVSNLYLY